MSHTDPSQNTCLACTSSLPRRPISNEVRVAGAKSDHDRGRYGLVMVAQLPAEPIKDCQAEWLLEERFPGWLHASKCGTWRISVPTYKFYTGYMAIMSCHSRMQWLRPCLDLTCKLDSFAVQRNVESGTAIELAYSLPDHLH